MKNDMEIGRWIMPGHDSKVLSWVDYVPQKLCFGGDEYGIRLVAGLIESFKFAYGFGFIGTAFRDADAKFAHIPHFLGAIQDSSASEDLRGDQRYRSPKK